MIKLFWCVFYDSQFSIMTKLLVIANLLIFCLTLFLMQSQDFAQKRRKHH